MSLVLLLLVVIGAVVALPFVLLARRRKTSDATSPAEVFTYLILIVSTLITTNSISSLLELIMPGDGVLISGADNLALSLSTLIVAGVVSVAVWIAMERNTTAMARPPREFYLALVIGASMMIVAGGAVRMVWWAFGASDFEPAALADVVAFGAAWFLHEHFRRPPEVFDKFRQLIGSVTGLALVAGGLSAILYESLSAIFSAGQVIAGGGTYWEELRIGVGALLVGVPYLWWFWLGGLANRPGAWRSGYATVISIFAWLTAFTSAAVILNTTAQWLFGLADGSLVSHFGSLPISLALGLVAAVVYWHHRPMLGNRRNTAIRIVEYLFSAVGLGVGAGAVVTLAAVLGNNMFVGESFFGNDSRLALGALTTLLVSSAAVWRYWVKAMALAEDPEERASGPRRATILILRFGFFLAGAGALVVVLFVLLRTALEPDSGQVAEILNVAVPVVVVSALMIWHLAEQRTSPDTSEPVAEAVKATRAVVVTVVAFDPGPLPSMLPEMRFLKRSDGVGVVDHQRAAEIVASLALVTSPGAVVTVDAEGFTVIPVN